MKTAVLFCITLVSCSNPQVKIYRYWTQGSETPKDSIHGHAVEEGAIVDASPDNNTCSNPLWAEARPLTCPQAQIMDAQGAAGLCVEGKHPAALLADMVLCDPDIKIIDARPPVQLALAKAIASMEGWCDDQRFARKECKKDTRVHRLHNPLALEWQHQEGATQEQPVCTQFDSNKRFTFCSGGLYAAFPTDEAGWTAGYRDIAAKWYLVCGKVECESHTTAEQRDNDEFRAFEIAYRWPSPHSLEYAEKVVAEMKREGGFK